MMETQPRYRSSDKARPGSSVSLLGGKYLTFHLNTHEYALPVHKVQEVVMVGEVTPVPNTPSFIRGLMTLREAIIPVIDLRAKFAMPAAPDADQACVVLVQIEHDGRTITLGVVVDEVREVTALSARDIQKTPDFGIPIDVQFILGVVKVESRVKLLLDIDFVLTTPEIIAVQDMLDSAGDMLGDDSDDTDAHEPPAKEDE